MAAPRSPTARLSAPRATSRNPGVSLAQVLYPAPTPQGLQEWSFNHFAHHQAIVDGLLTAKGVSTQLYRIWPVDFQKIDDWALQHQMQHDEMSAALGFAGTDLSQFNYQNQKQFDAWLFEHYTQHQIAGQLLGLPI